MLEIGIFLVTSEIDRRGNTKQWDLNSNYKLKQNKNLKNKN